jgi:hypothetical protein
MDFTVSVAAHPELLAEAAASPIVQGLGKTIRRRRPDPKQELVCEIQVQNAAPLARPQHLSIEVGEGIDGDDR